jgi:hypothetical protein
VLGFERALQLRTKVRHRIIRECRYNPRVAAGDPRGVSVNPFPPQGGIAKGVSGGKLAPLRELSAIAGIHVLKLPGLVLDELVLLEIKIVALLKLLQLLLQLDVT